MTYVYAFKAIIPQEFHTEWQSDLEFLDRINLETADIKNLIRYCKIWACLSEFLSCKRPTKLHKKLLFRVGEYETNSYWFNLVYWSVRCGEQMLDEIAGQLALANKLTPPALSNAIFQPSTLADLVFLIFDSIGLLYYCSTKAYKTSKWVEIKMRETCDKLSEVHDLLRLTLCFIEVRLAQSKWHSYAKMVSTLDSLLLSKRWASLQMVDAIRSDCEVQKWLVRGLYYIQETNEPAKSASCYENASLLGWNLSDTAKNIIEERDSLRHETVNEETLIRNCVFPSPILDPALRGKSPLEQKGTFLENL